MSKRQIIDALAKRFVHRRYAGGRGPHNMAAGIYARLIRRYARNWLTEHGSLPTGEHVITGRLSGIASRQTIRVDFDRLMHDPGYPSSVYHAPPPSSLVR